MTTPPRDGIHLDIPEQTYHCWDLCSASRLRILESSTPLHVRHACDFPESWDTPAKQLGRAAHCLILEPHRWAARYAQAPECGRRTKEGKQLWADFCQLNEGREVLKAETGQRAQEIAESVLSHDEARSALLKAEMREVSVVTSLFGSRFKARIDAYGEGIVVDLKTTSGSAGEEAFEKSIWNYGYGLQAAAYCRALDSVHLPVKHYVFIVVESEPPHAVAVYRLKDELISLFDEKLPRLCGTYAECVRTRRWPGFTGGIREIGIPVWAQRQLEREVMA